MPGLRSTMRSIERPLPRQPRHRRRAVAEISDELLMAYADGALDPDHTRNSRGSAAEQHPEYREKVEKFRATRDPVRIAFQEDVGTGHLGPLIDRIRRDEVSPAATAASSKTARVVPLSGVRSPTDASRFRHRLPAAMAASVALLVGAAFGWLAAPGAKSDIAACAGPRQVQRWTAAGARSTAGAAGRSEQRSYGRCAKTAARRDLDN